MRSNRAVGLLLAGAVGIAWAQQVAPPSSTHDLGAARDVGIGSGMISADGIGRRGTGDAGPDRDLGTSAAGVLDQGDRVGTGDTTGDTQTRTAIDDPVFLRLDANRNGAIDRAEAQLDAAVADRFAAGDSNGDGSLSLSEFQALGDRR